MPRPKFTIRRLEAKVSRVSLMNKNELSAMAQWKGSNKKLAQQVRQLRSQLQTYPRTWNWPTRSYKAPEAVHRRCAGISANPSKQRPQSHDPIGQGLYLGHYLPSIRTCDSNWTFIREDTQALFDRKLALTQCVNAMTNMLIHAQLNEKAMMASRDPSTSAQRDRETSGEFIPLQIP